MIRVKCSSCDKIISAKDEFSGIKTQCPNCKAIAIIPLASPTRVDAGEQCFFCPKCKASVPFGENGPGYKFPCPSCGQRLQTPQRPRKPVEKTVLGLLNPIETPQAKSNDLASEIPTAHDIDQDSIEYDAERPTIQSPSMANGRRRLKVSVIIIGSLVIMFLPTPFVVWLIHHTIKNREVATKQGQQQGQKELAPNLNDGADAAAKKKIDNQKLLEHAEARISRTEKTAARLNAYDEFPEPHKSDLMRDWKKELAAIRKSIAADKISLNSATTSAEGAKYLKYITIRTDRLACLLRNDPLYVTREAAERAARYEEKTNGKKLAKAKRKAEAEAEANAKNEENRKVYDDQVKAAKATYAKEVENHEVGKKKFIVAMKQYGQQKAEYDAAKEFNLALTLNNGNTVEAAKRRFREVIKKYSRNSSGQGRQVSLGGWIRDSPQDAARAGHADSTNSTAATDFAV
jgi:phage FluMu protein Com